MSTITVSAVHAVSSTTPFERTLLRTAAVLDLYVAGRLERRASSAARSREAARTSYVNARTDAQAQSALGMLPR